MNSDEILNIAEIPYGDGSLRFRYARYLAPDGKQWIRHGLFQEFYGTGALASEGEYSHGLEEGLWRDYHENGALAAEGAYRLGVKQGVWKFWSADGHLESVSEFTDGEESVIKSG